MLVAWWLAAAFSFVDSPRVTNPQRVSEQLYYLDPYQAGTYSCTKTVAKKQNEIFERQYGRRIAELKRKEVLVLGPDPGFDAIALGRCNRDNHVRSERFIEALRKFDIGLTALEKRWS